MLSIHLLILGVEPVLRGAILVRGEGVVGVVNDGLLRQRGLEGDEKIVEGGAWPRRRNRRQGGQHAVHGRHVLGEGGGALDYMAQTSQKIKLFLNNSNKITLLLTGGKFQYTKQLRISVY